MPAIGRWDSHIQVAELVRDGVLDRDEVAAAIRDLGDRLDAAMELVRHQDNLIAELREAVGL